MSELTLEQELSLDLIHTFLRFTNTDFVIAGGFPRDLHFGLTPKDIDVFIHINDYDQVEKMLDHSFLAEKYRTWNPKELGSNKRWYKDLDHVEKVIKPFWDWEVDFIFIDRDLDKTIDTFDYNINQFIFEGGVPVYKGTHPLDKLVCLNDKTKDKRKIKMKAKFNKIYGG